MARPSYHHGDLQVALLEAAVALIEERGLQHLSLRECARRAGVSHAAPYRHFADKDALLHAIAAQGFAWLHQAGLDAMVGVTAPRDRLDAYGIAYVRFAVEHPVHHRVMFTAALGPSDKDAPMVDGAFGLLREAVSAVVGPDVDPQEAALAAWSLSHGLSMLVLDGRIPEEHIGDADAVERLARRVFALWRGPLRGPLRGKEP